MVNPYQAPPDTVQSSPNDAMGFPLVQFHLRKKQIRSAEARYVLYRCGGRVTIASLALIGIAVWVAMLVTNRFGQLPAGAYVSIPLLVAMLATQGLVMGIAVAIYQSLVWKVRQAVRRHHAQLGVIDGAMIEVGVSQDELIWSTAGGPTSFPTDAVQVLRAGVGLIVVVALDRFLLIPINAFASAEHRQAFLAQLAESSTRPDQSNSRLT